MDKDLLYKIEKARSMCGRINAMGRPEQIRSEYAAACAKVGYKLLTEVLDELARQDTRP
jgi:hypothetical protein